MLRRHFLEMVGQVGGASAVHGSMEVLGLLATPKASSFALTGRGNGRKVVVLGAGLAGMTVAYELGKLGYDVHVLESRGRSGGRCHTIRRDVVESDIDGHTQTCDFADGLYFNPGPMRIPYHHTDTISYCRELGIDLQVFCNVNEAAYYYGENKPGAKPMGTLAGKRVRVREVRADMEGYTAELFAKAINAHALDEQLTADDRERMLEFIRATGGLTTDFKHAPSATRGYAIPRGAGNRPGVIGDPYGFEELLQSGFANRITPRNIDMQMTMFQPVGGMDRIAAAFASKLGGKITYEAQVREIRRDGDGGVRVGYAVRGGALKEFKAELCVCTIPLPVLAKIPADFSKGFADAIAKVPYTASGKIGLQFNRRFWEEDDQIYGGTSSVGQTISSIVYPSFGYLGAKGVLIGAYTNGANAEAVAAMAPADRVKLALAEGAKVHPQYQRHFESGFSVYWARNPHNLGGWAQWSAGDRKNLYPMLNQPDGPVYLAGEHLSYIGGWMSGAFESGRSVATAIHSRMARTNNLALTGAE